MARPFPPQALALRSLIALALVFMIASSAVAEDNLPRAGASLYVVWGHSEAGGHDSLETAQNVLHGDHIWAALDGKKESEVPVSELRQNPPPNTFGSQG